MKKQLYTLAASFLFFGIIQADTTEIPSKFQLLQAMFENIVIKKNVALIPEYYSKDLVSYSNGTVMDYDQFYHFHQKVYQSDIHYQVSFDHKTIVENGNKIALQMKITVQAPPAPPHEIKVILIAAYQGDKIDRIWEMTYPDWSNMQELSDISSS